jgi:hypothetical protein
MWTLYLHLYWYGWWKHLGRQEVDGGTTITKSILEMKEIGFGLK